jgi:hypothetical protein
VERVAAERIGRETVQYVSNIYKYYIAYQLSLEEINEREKAKGRGVGHSEFRNGTLATISVPLSIES